MRGYTGPVTTALAAPGIIVRGMVLFALPSGNYGFWEGDEPFTSGGVSYKPGGQLIEAGPYDQSLGLDSNAITLKLYANPDAGLTVTVLQTIEAEDYHQKPVTISKALFNADTRALISVYPIWRGKIDQVTHEDTGDSYAIVAKCESRSIDFTRRGFAVASNAQQDQISSGDRFFEYSGVAGSVEIAFGRESTRKMGKVKKQRPIL